MIIYSTYQVKYGISLPFTDAEICGADYITYCFDFADVLLSHVENPVIKVAQLYVPVVTL